MGKKKVHLQKAPLKASTSYPSTIKSLEESLNRLKHEANVARRVCCLAKLREQVLLDFVIHQELVLRLLAEQQADRAAGGAAAGGSTQQLSSEEDAAGHRLPAHNISHSGQQDDSNGLSPLEDLPAVSDCGQEQQQQQQQQQNSAGSCGQLGPPRTSYVAQLLLAATEEQVARVCSMTAADWGDFFRDSFARLVILLELCSREDLSGCQPGSSSASRPTHQQQQQQGATAAGQPASPATAAATAAAAAAATDAPPSPPATPSSSCCSSHPPGLHQWPAQPPAATTAAAAAAAAPISAVPGVPTGVSFDSDVQQLHQLVDEWVTLSALALLHNPMPVYVATTLNHATRQPATPPDGYWRRVVRRLALTPQQVAHFAVAMGEIGRLDEMTVHEGGALAADAACPGILVLAAEAEQQRSSSGTLAALASQAGTAAASAGDAQMLLDTPAPDSAAPPQQQQQQQQGAVVDGRRSSGSEACEPMSADGFSGGGGSGGSHWQQGQPLEDCTALPVKAEVLLQRKVQRMPLQVQLLLAFNCNTLTKMQLAHVLVASFPFVPMTGSVASAAAELYHDRLLAAAAEPWQVPQQQPQQSQQQQQQQELLQAVLPADLLPAAVDVGLAAAGPATWQQQHVQQLRRRQSLLRHQQYAWWQEQEGFDG